MNEMQKKITFFLVMSVIYPNILFFVLARDMYTDPWIILAFIVNYSFTFTDTILRPFPKQQEKVDIYSKLILLAFFLYPLFMVLSFIEKTMFISQFLPFWENPGVVYFGFLLLINGGIITTIGRTQLEKFASGRLEIQEDHQLIDSGIFAYIRNPIYLGSLLMIIGLQLIYRSMIVLVIVVIFYFLLFRGRIIEEERILQAEFGEIFTNYRKRTKRLIPFLY